MFLQHTYICCKIQCLLKVGMGFHSPQACNYPPTTVIVTNHALYNHHYHHHQGCGYPPTTDCDKFAEKFAINISIVSWEIFY